MDAACQSDFPNCHLLPTIRDRSLPPLPQYHGTASSDLYLPSHGWPGFPVFMMCSDVIVTGTDEAVSRAKTLGLFLGARGGQGSLATEQGAVNASAVHQCTL